MTGNADDDDFDDIFSFGAADGSVNIDALATSTSNFDTLTKGEPLNDDNFEDMFGSPPATPATPYSPLVSTNSGDLTSQGSDIHISIDDFHVHDAGTRDFLEWLDDDVAKKTDDDKQYAAMEISDENIVSNMKKNNFQVKNSVDEGLDDFDFDQILAEADSTSDKFENMRRSDVAAPPLLSEEQAKPIEADIYLLNGTSRGILADFPSDLSNQFSLAAKPREENISNGTAEQSAMAQSCHSHRSVGTISPEPTLKPYVSACIEEELSFEQWDKSENDEDNLIAADGNELLNANDNALDQTNIVCSRSSSSPIKVVFTSLSDAVRSPVTNIDDIRCLFTREANCGNLNYDMGVSIEDRPYLWTKIICSKVLGELDNGSLADSFREGRKKNKSSRKYCEEQSAMIEKMMLEAGSNIGGIDEDLISVLMFHNNDKTEVDETLSPPTSIDPLIAPVAYAVLQSGIPPAAASVILSQIEPTFMPLLRLSQSERYVAARPLHSEFYLLASYHLPLLIMHLDRHCPGWYWQKKRTIKTEVSEHVLKDDVVSNPDESACAEDDAPPKVNLSEAHKSKLAQENGGLVPLSWFVSNFAGETGGPCLDHNVLLPLWDYLMITGDNSRKFFLAVAILDKHSDALLMSRGKELTRELQKVFNFKMNSFDEESFVGARSGVTSSHSPYSSSDGIVSEWVNRAQSIFQSTPSSVATLLRSADDLAINEALKCRQIKMDENAKAQLEAQEVAMKTERDERESETKKTMMKARLVAYYRNHNPEKVDSIDNICKIFDGRMRVLNEKLKKKYGEGFLPDEPLRDHVSNQTRSFFTSVNQSISDTKRHVMTVAERRKKNTNPTASTNNVHNKIALEVSPTEIIPQVCSIKGLNHQTGGKWSVESPGTSSLKFYLIDSRPELIATEQGRFPTAVNMSPQKLQDPDELQKLTDMFESMRGAVHICVMGEGLSSFPALYDHRITEDEEKLLEDDISRTSGCCLFFLKKGFPFVSILRGGFAAAHAFLWRSGPEMGIPPSDVLIDYDPVLSLFAQLESSRQEQEEFKNASAREKTTRTLQKIIDSSMTRLTFEEQRLNNLASDLSKPETVDKIKQSVTTLKQKVSTIGISFGRTHIPPLKTDDVKHQVSTNESTLQTQTLAANPGQIFSTATEQESAESEKQGSTAEQSQHRFTIGMSNVGNVDESVETKHLDGQCLTRGSQLKYAFSGFGMTQPAQSTNPKTTTIEQVTKPTDKDKPEDKSEDRFMSSKLASFTKSFGSKLSSGQKPSLRHNPFAKLLHHRKEVSEQSLSQDLGETKLDGKESGQDLLQPQSGSPIKISYDDFTKSIEKSIEAGISSANRLLSEISKHEDPFHPKNMGPVQSRFGAKISKDDLNMAPVIKVKPPLNGDSLYSNENDNNDDEVHEIDFSTTNVDSINQSTVSCPFEKASSGVEAMPNDLFHGLGPQPRGDPTLDLFDVVFDRTAETAVAEENSKN